MAARFFAVPIDLRGREADLFRFAGLTLLGSGIIAVAAHIALRVGPVPLTVQSLAVFLIGASFGPAIGASAALAYIVEGLLGLPVFAHGAGFGVLMGASGGYLVGYVPASIVAGQAARLGRGWRDALLAALLFLLADGVIFLFGVSWIATLVGWSAAPLVGVLPFVKVELVKGALAVALLQCRKGRFRR